MVNHENQQSDIMYNITELVGLDGSLPIFVSILPTGANLLAKVPSQNTTRERVYYGT